MTAMKKLQQQFQHIAQARGLDIELESSSIDVRTQVVSDMGELINLIQTFEADSGWLATQSSNLMLDEWRATPQRFGAILQAELEKGMVSLHIRLAREGWTVTWLQEQMEGGEPCLVEKRSLVRDHSDHESLQYRIYWQALSELGFRATFFRFAGMQGARP